MDNVSILGKQRNLYDILQSVFDDKRMFDYKGAFDDRRVIAGNTNL